MSGYVHLVAHISVPLNAANIVRNLIVARSAPGHG